jgi:hypothetical protein
MTHNHGRCAKGEPRRMGFPDMVAPMVLDSPIIGDWFKVYVSQVLVPELRLGDIVIMDDLSS